MTHYTILPLEAVFDGIEELKQVEEIVMNGITMQVQPIGTGRASIVRLISCKPEDYLNPQYAPGRIIDFVPVVRQ